MGMSTNPARPSYFVGRYLSQRGYRVIPINPGAAGQAFFGETVLADLGDIPKDTSVQMVDIFRQPDAVPGILEDALTHLRPSLSTIWMQFGVIHEGAAERARAEGLQVVMDLCPKLEHQRHFGDLRKAGLNTGIISSKLPDWQ